MEKKKKDRKAYQHQYQKEYFKRKSQEFPLLARTKCKAYRERYPRKAAEQSRVYRAKCRYEAIKFYSNGEMCCSCCGENHYEFLNIDHINGEGNKMRRELVGHGNLGQWLKSRGFPSGFRVLCYNCNMARGHYGYCPHQKE